MVSVAQLWLPILVSAALVFVASAVLWMAFPHHKGDFKPLAKDSPIPGQLKGLPAGVYMFPGCADHAEMKTQEFKKRYDEGPWGIITLRGTKMSMGANMAMGFLVYVLISVFVAYVTGLARPAGASYLDVFRVAGATAIGIYCLGWMPGGIWFSKPRRAWVTDIFDCAIYGLLTAGTFAWLWPSASDAVNHALGS